jgi:hypothetical protein
MRGNGSSWETRIPRWITTRTTMKLIKVSSGRIIEQKHKDSNEKQQQGNDNDRNMQTDKTTNMIRRIRVRKRIRI